MWLSAPSRSRLEGLAEPGGICIARSVYDSAAGSDGMNSLKAKAVLIILCMFTCVDHALALDCGSVPPVQDEKLKGAIADKATFLSKLLGNAQLSGEIESAKSDIFSQYPDADRSRTNAYFFTPCVNPSLMIQT